jgi:glycosyltransferase involved in cell wall biosynthesis
MAQNTLSPIRKFYYNQQYIKIRREEIDTCRKHDAIFVTSAMDKACFDRDIPSVPKYIIPNGVDTGYFQPFTSPPEPHSLVFTGMMAYVPNYDGMLYFLDNIFPLIQREVPDVKIYIVGSRPPRKLMNRASENIVITGFVEDVRPYVSRASVYVVPLRMGGGTRLKVLEAMAMKKPIVTTSIGCEGIDVGHNESVLIADDPQDFAEQVIQLFRTSALTHTLVRNGYDLVRTRYDWGIIGNQVDAAYQSLIKLSTSSDRPRKRAFAMDLTTTVTP